MARTKTSKAAIERAKRQEQALKYRLAGATIRDIAAKMDISKSTAQRLVAQAIAEIKREPAEQVIDMELNRLDIMLMGLWKDATSGDTKAVDAALRLMKRRADLMGLDQLAAMKLATDTKSLSAIDAWAADMLGRNDKLTAADAADITNISELE